MLGGLLRLWNITRGGRCKLELCKFHNVRRRSAVSKTPKWGMYSKPLVAFFLVIVTSITDATTNQIIMVFIYIILVTVI